MCILLAQRGGWDKTTKNSFAARVLIPSNSQRLALVWAGRNSQSSETDVRSRAAHINDVIHDIIIYIAERERRAARIIFIVCKLCCAVMLDRYDDEH